MSADKGGMDSHSPPLEFLDSIRENAGAWVSTALLGAAAVYFTVTRNDYSFMDSIDLVIHEAGHIFFAFFGEFIRMAGGTLLQILLPAGLAVYFYINTYRFGHQLMLFWLGQSLLNVSVYAADARAQALPLLGGSRVTHDWHYMLSKTNLLAYDQFIAGFFVFAAVCVFVAMVAAPRHMI